MKDEKLVIFQEIMEIIERILNIKIINSYEIKWGLLNLKWVINTD